MRPDEAGANVSDALMAMLCKSSLAEKETGRRTLILALGQWVEEKSRALNVMVGIHNNKWHGIGHTK